MLTPWAWFAGNCRHYRKRIGRSWAFARIGWENYDFDSGYLLQLMVFKLKRLYIGCTKDAWAEHEKKHLQALRLAIRLGARLDDDQYMFFQRQHDRKWGDLQLDTTVNNAGFHTLRSWRANVTDDTAEEARVAFLAAVAADGDIQKRDARLFFRIIEKYYPFWWD